MLTENNLAGALSQLFSWRGVGSRGLVIAEIELADEFINNKHETGADVIAEERADFSLRSGDTHQPQPPTPVNKRGKAQPGVTNCKYYCYDWAPARGTRSQFSSDILTSNMMSHTSHAITASLLMITSASSASSPWCPIM